MATIEDFKTLTKFCLENDILTAKVGDIELCFKNKFNVTDLESAQKEDEPSEEDKFNDILFHSVKE